MPAIKKPQLAERRILCLKRKLSRDAKFHDATEVSVTFLEEVISEGYARKVTPDVVERSDGKVWFISHHGVYHHQEPDKIRVVFDCSTQFQGISLNNKLFKGPDITNILVHVLTRPLILGKKTNKLEKKKRPLGQVKKT